MSQAAATSLTYTEHTQKAAANWKTVTRKKQRPATVTTKSNLANVAPTTTTKAWPIEKLTKHATTVTMIWEHTEAVYGKKLGTKMKKASLIVAYQQLATTSNSMTPNALKAKTVATTLQQSNPNMSEWTICHLPNTGALGNVCLGEGDPLKLVCAMQTALCQMTGEAKPTLTLLTG